MVRNPESEHLAGVLISDVNSRKAFDVVNIVQHKLKLPVILASAKDYRFQLPLVYGKKVHRLRFDNIFNYEDDLNLIVSKFTGTIIYMPVSEIATRFFISLREQNKLQDQWRFILPSLKAFNTTSDKYLFQQFCEHRGHPVPFSVTFDTLEALRHNFRPVVLKPKSGQGSVGIRYFEKKEDLPGGNEIDWDKNLIQEKIIARQKVAGAFFLRYKGSVLSEYCHQRHRTFPPEGGVTVYSESVIYPEILEIGRKLLDDLEWEGLAMIEFMFDEPSQSWRIIELNPRLWGSVMLSAFNGSDMLKSYVDASLETEATEAMIVPRSQIKSVFIRWLFPFEILSLLKGDHSFKEFSRFNFNNTCYVNFTYASFPRALCFLTYFTFNLRSLTRYIKKLQS